MRDGLDKEWDLYNVSKDPTETQNLAPDNPERVGEMETLFLQWKEDVGAE